MSRIKAVVVDDEENNRRLITDLICELGPDFDIAGEAGSVKEAYHVITGLQPDVVFLDIKMPDGSGFSLLNMFAEVNFEVVFISAFNSYALKAFEFNALDYIVKPIDPERFAKNLSQVQAKIEQKTISTDHLRLIMQAYDPGRLIISKIPVHWGKKVMLLAIEELIYIQAQMGNTLFKLLSGDKYLTSRQLCDFEFILEKHPCMIRVNKAMYININHILSYSKGNACFIILKDGTEVEVPRRKKAQILELISGKK